jgi:hypothetical protein
MTITPPLGMHPRNRRTVTKPPNVGDGALRAHVLGSVPFVDGEVTWGSSADRVTLGSRPAQG